MTDKEITLNDIIEEKDGKYVMNSYYNEFLMNVPLITNINSNDSKLKLSGAIKVEKKVDTDKYKVLYTDKFIKKELEKKENHFSMEEITNIDEFEKKFDLFRKTILNTNDSKDIPVFLNFQIKKNEKNEKDVVNINSSSPDDKHFKDISEIVTSNSNFHYDAAKICLRFFFKNHNKFSIEKGFLFNNLKLNVKTDKDTMKDVDNVRLKGVRFPIDITYKPPFTRNNFPTSYNIKYCYFYIYSYMDSLFNKNSEFNKWKKWFGGNTRKRKSRANRKSKKSRKTKTRKNKKRRPTKK